MSSDEKEVTDPETVLPSAEGLDEARDVAPNRTCWQRIVAFCIENDFVLMVISSILLAKAYPPLGAIYLFPDITATWIAVILIFIMAGLSLKSEELANAFKQVRFNMFVQTYNFFFISPTVFGFVLLLKYYNVIADPLADGMVACASLPMTINLVCVLTRSANGDEAAAVFNAAFGNLVGVFLSPTLILLYLGTTGDVGTLTVFFDLFVRVVVPVGMGQFLQKAFKSTVGPLVKKYKQRMVKLRQLCMIFIIYTVFCTTFNTRDDIPVNDIFLMVFFQLFLMGTFMSIAWTLLGIFFTNHPKLRVMGLFGCCHKTVAMGVPLITTIYAGNTDVGLYTLPLLVWHPSQILVGSFLVPYLAKFVESEEKRLSQEATLAEEPLLGESILERGETANLVSS